VAAWTLPHIPEGQENACIKAVLQQQRKGARTSATAKSRKINLTTFSTKQ